jgi:hypothetical protein
LGAKRPLGTRPNIDDTIKTRLSTNLIDAHVKGRS